jgi:hypothetical protein
MSKVKIAVSDLVCYRSNTGAQILGRVRKVNRVNSKVQIWAVNGRIVWRPDPVTVYKAFLRRASPTMVDFAEAYEF